MGVVLNKIIENLDSNSNKARIIYPEGWNPQIQEAAKVLVGNKRVKPILIYRTKSEYAASSCKTDDFKSIVIEEYDLDGLANFLFELRKSKGMTLEEAKSLVSLPNYFCTLLLKQGIADGYVGGIEMTTRDTLKPALQIIKTGINEKMVASAFIMERGNEKYVFGDCAINLDPNPSELAAIANSISNFTINVLGVQNPSVAMLSYSTDGSGVGLSSDKVREAIKLLNNDQTFKGNSPCEMQFDTAFVSGVRKKKAPNSKWDSESALVYIFPNLDSGNIGYKIAQRLGGFEATGPILTGLALPVNDLSRGASSNDVVNVSYITALQALSLKK